VLTVIVPITNMAGKLQNLAKWIPIAANNKIGIVIVHDISDSATQSELESLLSSFNSESITLTSGYYGSPGAARNQGLSLANSKYISFWDADDLPNPIQVYDSILNSKIDFDILIGQYVIRNHSVSDQIILPPKDTNIKSVAFSPGLWRMVFRREFINELSFKQLQIGEDQIFFAECLCLSPKFMFSTSVFYEYFRGVEGQLTRKYSARPDLIEVFEIIRVLRSFVTGPAKQLLSIMLLRIQITILKSIYVGAMNFSSLSIFFLSKSFRPTSPFTKLKAIGYVIFRLLRKFRV